MKSAIMILVNKKQCNIKLVCICAISSQSVYKEYGDTEVSLSLKNEPSPS